MSDDVGMVEEENLAVHDQSEQKILDEHELDDKYDCMTTFQKNKS